MTGRLVRDEEVIKVVDRDRRDDADLRASLRRLEESIDDLARDARGAAGRRAARLAEDLEQRARRLRRQLEESEAEHEFESGNGQSPAPTLTAKRSNGWLRDLYRDPERAWLAGVCAGIARYLGVEPWVIRLVAVSLFLFNAFVMFWAYIAGVLLLARRPEGDGGQYLGAAAAVSDTSPAPELGARLAPRPGMRNLRLRFTDMEARLRRMESYVTSREFSLQRELTALENDGGQ